MQIGFSLPQLGPQAHQGAEVARFAREVEFAGADSLWVGDRWLAATEPSVGYAGTAAMPREFGSVLDPFVLLSAAAVVTERVRLGSNVLVAPLYRAVALARSLTSIDVLSGGRLIAGLGIGWSPEEYAAAGVPFASRGARLEETLDALQAIWTRDPVGFSGRFVSLPEHHSELKPVQRPHPPIHLPGFTAAAIARVGRRADGWLPVLRVPGPEGQGARLRQARAVVDAAAEEAGRDPGVIETVVRVNVARGSGAPEIAAAIEQVAEETGFEHFFVDLLYVVDTVDAALETAVHVLDRLR
ncbi:TIGR03619 family F420-dependent LLM class oxidoreductase [Nocardia sp. CDC159]|uniref:TIGR03619 family F420-dependent LLM class oxidoreductase n=1 Tax=Nocardia pulmonis TaxID=2951408 RepID=A0A9X2IY58_9NOCA|nr:MULTISPECIES: TIGR03619 family F420-dependent LLM class oxidoreductase [Nocardia]MCM6775344.1 TIGR03619 family F420-dependent LLM class oxidoreductase [Nocardia pulmonis]MCM6787922.1 TIGR03619 family F420-dependent LLM class oxidoreductase [Nocardia sp. CDC159]